MTPSALLHEFFDRFWPARRGAVAIDIPPGSARQNRLQVTYGELAARSLDVTAALAPLVRGESLVAILLPRTALDAYAAPLGILRAGAAYTAIDASFPDDRVRDILEDATPAAVVTDAAGAERVRRLGVVDEARIVLTSIPGTEVPGLHQQAVAPPPPWLTPASLAYVIYTSGTTGQPKGVMIEHRAIANLVQSDLDEFHLGPADRVGHGSSHAYDSSIEEVWLALASGATLVVMDDEVVRSGPDLVPWLERERVTVLCPPPTLLRAMGRRSAEGLLPHLSLLYVGGEALTRDVADVWAPGRRMVNGYGPTECTVTAVRGPVPASGVIDIGRPIAGVDAWILDASLHEVADGERGELCLGGAGLARGYWRAPDLTERKFPVHPRLGRIYRTGDLAYRGSDGAFVCLGRLDAQVKIRGYRVELEEIETHLSRVPGVRAAACRVDGDGARQRLAAFIVARDPGSPPAAEDLRAALGAALPVHMVPSHYEFVATLPTTTGGKLDRAALPVPGTVVHDASPGGEPPANDIERVIELATRHAWHRDTPVSVEDDFFADLGGDSLWAAELVTALRETPITASLTVRDVYSAPTVRALAARASSPAATPFLPHAAPRVAAGHAGRGALTATALQTAWLVAQVMVATLIASTICLEWVPAALETYGLVRCLLVAPLAVGVAIAGYAAVALIIAILAKHLLIGRYVARTEPVWSGFYIRNWIVQRMVRLAPWPLFGGGPLQHVALRALGARIGRRVHLHRGVDLLQGGWDLLDIGDDVTIGQDVALRLVELDAGQIVVAPIVIGDGATLDARAGVGGGAHVGAGAWITALSMVPEGARIPPGERWDGVPAAPAGTSPARPAVDPVRSSWTPSQYARRLMLARLSIGLGYAAVFDAVAIGVALARGSDAEGLMIWLLNPVWSGSAVATLLAITVLPIPVMLVCQALAARWLSRGLMSLHAGSEDPASINKQPAIVISRWSADYLRVWIVTGFVRTAGEWLSGALMWPWWLRLAGMTIGPDGEISTIIDVVPALVAVGPESFLADGIYLAGPCVHRGTVTLSRSTLGANTFIGNHAVIAMGQRLPSDLLIGVSTVADDARMRPGTSWFGHPPFALARRPATTDRRLTHDPPLVRRANRWFWELLRFLIPVVPAVAFIVWIQALAAALAGVSLVTFVFVAAPAISGATAAGVCLVVLAMKWLLIGRVSPGEHPLWSCWCSRWDFLYVAWQRLAAPILSGLEGTLWLAWYLRAMGARIGRRVVLAGGFSQVVDPDMLQIDDDATVHALFQAHTFEDRVLKIDRIRIRRRASVADGAVLFYGADIGEDTWVAPHSVVMKRERLTAGRAYEGAPTREVTRSAGGEGLRSTGGEGLGSTGG